MPHEALLEYWTSLPEEHRATLFSMREEDFVAELDAYMKYHLRICKDCRGNVMRAFKVGGQRQHQRHPDSSAGAGASPGCCGCLCSPALHHPVARPGLLLLPTPLLPPPLRSSSQRAAM